MPTRNIQTTCPLLRTLRLARPHHQTRGGSGDVQMLGVQESPPKGLAMPRKDPTKHYPYRAAHARRERVSRAMRGLKVYHVRPERRRNGLSQRASDLAGAKAGQTLRTVPRLPACTQRTAAQPLGRFKKQPMSLPPPGVAGRVGPCAILVNGPAHDVSGQNVGQPIQEPRARR